jgi:hypothetical protein
MPEWRTSSYTDSGTCVAVANLDTNVAIRNSQHPDRNTLTIPIADMKNFIAACKTGEFDDLS